MKQQYESLSPELENIGKIIFNSALKVHRILGPGLLEKVYEIAFCHELSKAGLYYQRQVHIPIVYDGITFDEGLRVDVFVENCVICELKAVDIVNPVWESQIISHLKLTNNRLGFLINFNTVLLKDGFRRFIR